jgi:GTP-binding protein EngB required for normal cell division
MDVRRPLQVGDRQMILASGEFGLPVQPAVTKSDKLGRSALQSAMRALQKELSVCEAVLPPLPLSNLSGEGAAAIREQVRAWLDADAD